MKHGFSLVELVITLAIIGILSGLGINGYVNSQKRSRDVRRQADLEAVRSALEQYRYDIGSYPAGGSYPGSLNVLRTGGFIQALPSDPTSASRYRYLAQPNGCAGVACRSYMLCASVEAVPTSADVSGCGNNCGRTCNYKVANP